MPERKRAQANGVVFVKMIKVGGELFSTVLSQFAHKKGWRAMQHKACAEEKNPLGQATCACNEHFIGPDDVPAAPPLGGRFSALYTHMHYDPLVLDKLIVPDALKLVLIRHPLSVLRSVHAMAAYQRVYEPWIHDNFCQTLALDGDLWRDKCEFMQTGQDSILDYLDPHANEKMRKLFLTQPQDLHTQAMAIIDDVAQRLEKDFIVGVQEDFDTSMLLFEYVLGWNRTDSLYMKDDPNTHHYVNPEVEKARSSWDAGKPQILDRLRRGPFRYHEILYQRGAEIHRKQVKKMLGSETQVKAAVSLYQKQNTKFTSCSHKICNGCLLRRNACVFKGLSLHTNFRPTCANVAIAKEDSIWNKA